MYSIQLWMSPSGRTWFGRISFRRFSVVDLVVKRGRPFGRVAAIHAVSVVLGFFHSVTTCWRKVSLRIFIVSFIDLILPNMSLILSFVNLSSCTLFIRILSIRLILL